jgi:hypothetical protein
MLDYNSLKYKIEHAGWLLACDAPKNFVKGAKELATLTPKQQIMALKYRDVCLIAYQREGEV